MEKILVTGGSGFIGTNLVDEISKNYEVVNVDIAGPKKEEHKKYWQKVDVNDEDKLEKVVMSFMPDYIVHLAARCDLDGNELSDYKTNDLGVRNILNIAKKVPTLKKIIITSSMLVCTPGYKPSGEKDYKPSTIYGESKILTEKNTWEAGLPFDWAIVRPTSIWGPWFGEPYFDFFRMVMKKRYIHIGGNNSRMTYGYVKNTVAQYLAILRADTTDIHNKVFYLGDYEPINIEIWADCIAKKCNIKIPTCPRIIINMAAITGDLLAKIGIKFPLTSFRLNNMLTSNVFELKNTRRLIPNLPVDISTGVRETVEWINAEANNV